MKSPQELREIADRRKIEIALENEKYLKLKQEQEMERHRITVSNITIALIEDVTKGIEYCTNSGIYEYELTEADICGINNGYLEDSVFNEVINNILEKFKMFSPCRVNNIRRTSYYGEMGEKEGHYNVKGIRFKW